VALTCCGLHLPSWYIAETDQPTISSLKLIPTLAYQIRPLSFSFHFLPFAEFDMGSDFAMVMNEDIDQEYRDTLSFVPQLESSPSRFPGPLMYPDTIPKRPIISLRRNAIAPIILDVEQPETDGHDSAVEQNLTKLSAFELELPGQLNCGSLPAPPPTPANSPTRTPRLGPKNRARKDRPNATKLANHVSLAPPTFTAPVEEVFQSITGFAGSFEELRLECYAYARSVRGEMDRPEEYDPSRPASEAYPPAFVPHVLRDSCAGKQDVAMDDSDAFQFTFSAGPGDQA